jgi:hypothetical protein
LQFVFQDNRKFEFGLDEFEELVREKRININHIKNHKAALFWSNSPRGIYSRASSGIGHKVLVDFMEFETNRLSQGMPSSLSGLLNGISNGEQITDIIELAGDEFSSSDSLSNSWAILISELKSATRFCVESTDYRSTPSVWKNSQRFIFDGRKRPSQDVSLDTPRPAVTKLIGRREVQPKRAKEQPLVLSSAEINTLLGSDSEFFCDPPMITKKPIRQAADRRRTPSKINYVEKSRRDKKLGTSGEEFVYALEKKNLYDAGKQHLADKVLWVSEEIGDGVGYDIRSYDENEEQIFIEVKTTKASSKAPFYISTNELEVS